MNLTLALPERVTHDQAQAVVEGLLSVVQTQPGPMVLNASALQTFDTSALAVIMACMRAAQSRGVELSVQGLPERARSLAQVYGVAELLSL
jgi:phospholipid transport system transporter-binding protein